MAFNQRTSIRNMADLARAGFEIARQPVTTVDFEVRHVRSRPGYLRALMRGEPAPTTFLETLCSSAAGVGVVIGTRTRGGAGALAAVAGRDDGQQRAEPPHQSPDGWIFQRTAWPNPAFIYESAETFEGLIAIDETAREARQWHGLAIRDLLREITDTATTVAEAPLLTLQCPAQLPTVVKTRNHDLSTRKETPSPCSSLAVRFAIALRDVSAAMRFSLADRFRELCEKHGFAFWLADTRPGHRPGNWFGVCAAGDGRSGRDSRSRERVHTCLPVTVAGPARIGSIDAIVAFLQRYPQVGVVGSAATTLADVSFTHLLLSIQGVAVERLNRILGKLLDGHAPAGPRKLLKQLFDRLGLRPDPVGPAAKGTEPVVPDLAVDYQAFAGPAFAYQPGPAPDALAVWVSWQVARSDDGLAVPMQCLYRALDRVVPELPGGPQKPLGELVTAEYLLCRATEESFVRGKAKLAVPGAALRRFSAGSVEPPAAKLCSALEDAWTAQVEQSGMDGVGELTVAWRESWLGHWSFL